MPRSILYEVHNLTLSSGTGIATYARELAGIARQEGYHTSALIGTRGWTPRRDPKLAQVIAFDADRLHPESLVEGALRIASYPFNALGGLRPVSVAPDGFVVGQSTLAGFDRVLAVPRLVETILMHFRLYGWPATLKIAQPPDVFHATHPLPTRVRRATNIYTIHDLVPLRLPYTTQDNKVLMYRVLRFIARTADHIVTVSENSRRDIIEYLGVDEKRVTNTYQSVGFADDLLAMPDEHVAHDLMKRFGLEFGNYFLFYGALEPKKNVARLVDAYAASGTSRPLVVAGASGWQNRNDVRKIRNERFLSFRYEAPVFRLERQVRWLQYVPVDELVLLIRGARAVLFPSLYEGFGLPVAESMLLGTPVMTSNTSSLPEVAGDAALTIDPYDVSAMARAISSLDQDVDLRTELSKRGRIQATKFSRSAYRERLGDLYKRVAG
jgi:glycosyltransferase involved in cell wall biosynthesis